MASSSSYSLSDLEDVKMFCFQCEQTLLGKGCTTKGVCQKNADVAALQDYLLYAVEALCAVAYTARERAGVVLDKDVQRLIVEAVFCTLTNVCFTEAEVLEYAETCNQRREELLKRVRAAGVEDAVMPLGREFRHFTDATAAKEFAKSNLQIPLSMHKLGMDKACIREMLMYGIKGTAAYTFHAMILGEPCDDVVNRLVDYLGHEMHREDATESDYWGLCLDCGKTNFAAMEHLDRANTNSYGMPEPTVVQWITDPEEGSTHPGKAILVSGHDLLELKTLLDQTAGTGVQVYTHGEMLPCNAYPKLKEYPHFAGHYGTAWQNQRREFLAFPGPVLMTTNCYIPAPDSYVDKMFACMPVAGVNVHRVLNNNYSELIAMAQKFPGFGPRKHPEATTTESTGKPTTLLIGFAHDTVLKNAGAVVDAVKAGALKRIYLIGGCDGVEKERNQYTELAALLPQDTLILTLACGKFKINGSTYGTLPGTKLPRLMDMGQCNDAFSALRVATALCDALHVPLAELPLTLVLSWFEQKAVCILLTLLHLGIKGIYLGPRKPAFVTDTMLQFLAQNFDLRLFTDAHKTLVDTHKAEP